MSVQIYSNIPLFQSALKEALLSQHIQLNGRARQILIDVPRGWALLNHPQLELYSTVIASDNPCPEYKLDLLAFKPAALVDQLTLSALIEAIHAVEAGKTLVPKVSSRLTPTERFTLQLVARGYSIKAVATIRGTKISTTRNTIQILYMKLGLKSAVQLAHYYYGNWAILQSLNESAETPFYSPLAS